MIIAIDPSGNFDEGKGTTGLAVLWFEDGKLRVKLDEVKASKFHCKEEYWDMVISDIRLYKKTTRASTLVVENYRLQMNKAMQQSWSELETPQLIGVIRYMNHMYLGMHWEEQSPSIKSRFADDVLVNMGILKKRGNRYYFQGGTTNDHMRDALRHGLYYLATNGYEKEVLTWKP